jgi:AcrR family transcriptional regulator
MIFTASSSGLRVIVMKDAAPADPKPYHHGDLSRALVDAAQRLLETEGLSALSLRAVAREAGVSPAAPYHHFKDKNELLEAIAQQGWRMMNDSIAAARAQGHSVREKLGEFGVAYVRFARNHPALYRVMYDVSRERADLPQHMHSNDSAYGQVRDTLLEAGADPLDRVGLEMATMAAWAAAHGLAEMAAFRQIEPLKQALGGEDAMVRGVFDHLGLFVSGVEPKA